MENNEFDVELLELKETLERDPSALQYMTAEQKEKLITFYSDLLEAKKAENERLKEKLKGKK